MRRYDPADIIDFIFAVAVAALALAALILVAFSAAAWMGWFE